ncbi:hypothetical protein COU20_03630 [Candidatus Kaiserbacteria bacterium CG10_big_fil_rev_8_21_14_0_10_59_10]|uniref:MgtC/SapB/SrpB/YhiD N-terminal domain-containing protein n=1 Tax=Candidatus Kaiserbacteria bacterium CG10_big_fil_rev_8_21_14_0_10_59_10 TaxID=1974612 RepID=A0A2H0U733_9BACT|nr:MAG: hypothetical protein COU20_03630 [Candidatus Kaiserbacteria bacterium CG10_big_fil_rev_8_21_14_0_10_59_10]
MPELFDTEAVILGKLLLATVLGLLIGTERALMARQAAGSRTFALVSLGSCLFIVAGLHIDVRYLGIVNFDPARVLAAVVQGIGFIGAGLIIFRGHALHGVTTAAGLWVAAAVGAMVGFGMYAIAIFAVLLALTVLFGMWYVENRFKRILLDNHPEQPEEPYEHPLGGMRE